MCFFFFFKQKTAYEMRISDWSSDVCSSDLRGAAVTAHPGEVIAQRPTVLEVALAVADADLRDRHAENAVRPWYLAPKGPSDHIYPTCPEIGRASCRERVCQYV